MRWSSRLLLLSTTASPHSAHHRLRPGFAASALPLGCRGEQRLLQRRLALLEALGAAPREALVGERRLRSALLAEALGCVVVDAALAKGARTQLALGRLACHALGGCGQCARHSCVRLDELERLGGKQGAESKGLLDQLQGMNERTRRAFAQPRTNAFILTRDSTSVKGKGCKKGRSARRARMAEAHSTAASSRGRAGVGRGRGRRRSQHTYVHGA